MMKKDTYKICIIGMPGSGKTTVGKVISQKLNYKFFDTDEEIETITKLKIREIFKYNGESNFREIETRVLKSLINKNEIVISTGGGVILKNQSILRKTFNIYLKCDLDVLVKRALRNHNRPLLLNDVERNMKILLKQRKDIYNKIADLEIDATSKLQNTIVNIIDKLP